MENQNIPLSKWWTTPSAQAAIQRAEKKKQDRIRKVREQFAERKAKLTREIWQA